MERLETENVKDQGRAMRYGKFTYGTPCSIWWPRVISTTRGVKLIENSTQLSRNSRRFCREKPVASPSSEAPPFDREDRRESVCNISGSPDSFPCPEHRHARYL